MMQLDERDCLDAQSVGINLDLPVPDEIKALFVRAMNICEFCVNGCPLMDESVALTTLRIATGRLLEEDFICDKMKSFVLSNRFKQKR